jgi:glycine oxidase ThiO
VKVIVVGAGVAGCAIAYELARRGAQVTLLDARKPGRGATFASAGILTPAVEGHNAPLLHLTSCSLAIYDEFIRRVCADSGLEIDYARNGTLQVAFTEAESNELKDNARRFESTGVEHLLLDAHEATALEPELSTSIVSALRLPHQGYVSAEQLVDALVQAASKRGATVVNSHVERIDDGPRGASVGTSQQTFEADAVVVATGSWSIPPFGTKQPAPVKPIRGQLLHLRVEESVAAHVLWGPHCYVVPWRDLSVLVGATVEDVGFDERATVEGVRMLLNAAAELVPALDRAQLQHVRVGLRPKTEDELPAIGRSSTMQHVFHAMGLFRNGVLLAPLTAMLVADLVLEGREHDELAMVRPDRFGL